MPPSGKPLIGGAVPLPLFDIYFYVVLISVCVFYLHFCISVFLGGGICVALRMPPIELPPANGAAPAGDRYI